MSRVPFEYAAVQLMPRVERGETMNAGVLLYSRSLDFLGARIWLDADRLTALDPSADVVAVWDTLQAVVALCGRRPAEAARYSGPAGEEDRGRRFRRLTAPRSTVVRAGPVHTGLTTDPDAELDRLLTALVLPVGKTNP